MDLKNLSETRVWFWFDWEFFSKGYWIYSIFNGQSFSENLAHFDRTLFGSLFSACEDEYFFLVQVDTGYLNLLSNFSFEICLFL